MDHLLSGGALLGGVNDIIRALPSAPHPSLPVGARLLSFVEAWSAITQDSWALSILRKGYRIPFAREPPLSLSPILFPVAQQHLNHLREEVQILLEKRAVEIVRDTTSPGFYSRIFLVKKKTDRFRLIIDLSSLNKMMKVDHFQMETAASIRRAIPPGAWAVSIDLMDAYLHIPIHPASRKYLRFSLEGTIYQFRALPFGISTAPFVFINLMEIVAGHSISRTQHSPIFRRLACPLSFTGVPTVRPFTSLGNHYKSGSNTKSPPLKSDLVPSQDFVYVEMRFLTHIGIVSSRRESQQNSCPAISGSTGSIHYRPRIFVHVGITQCSSRFSSVRSPSYETSSVPSSGQLETSLRQFCPIYSNIPFMSCSNQMVDESFHLCGWNSPCYTNPRFPSVLEPLGLEVQGLWDVASQDLHINNLELRAVFLALQHFQSHIYNSCVMVASDNSSVVAYLKKQGGTHSPSLCMLVWELLYWCHHRNIHIQVRHIPGKLNVLADSLSHPDRILPTEWSLDREIAHQIFSLWGTPQIDLFATRLNHLLPLFVSPVPDHRACAVDAMSLEWKNLFAYAFPPFKLVPLVLNKIRDSNSRFILIALCWSQRSWFSVILSLIIDFPRELPVHRGLVSQHQGKVLHQNPAMLHLHAWKLSGVKSEVDTFLNSLPSVSLNPAESLRSRSTLRGGRYSRIGVCKGKLILSIPL